MKCHDDIIADVWANREAYAALHDHDLHKIVADLQKRQKTPFTHLVDRRQQTKTSAGLCDDTHKDM